MNDDIYELDSRFEEEVTDLLLDYEAHRDNSEGSWSPEIQKQSLLNLADALRDIAQTYITKLQ